MSDTWEDRYLEDVLPAIEEYAAEETSGFTSQDIADRLDGYSPQMVGKTLKYVTENDETSHVIYTGNNPKTWEAVLLDGVAWERVENQLEVQPQTAEEELGIGERARKVLEEHPEQGGSEIYTIFLPRIQDSDLSIPEKVSRMSKSIDEDRPTVSRDLLNFDPGAYGKIRKYFDDVYDELQEMKDERSGFFDSTEISERLEDAPEEAAGLVLKALEKADLVEGYEDKRGYFPESLDEEELREFGRAVKNSEKLEDLREKLDRKED